MAPVESGDGPNLGTRNQNLADGGFPEINLDPSSPESDVSHPGPVTVRSIVEAPQNVVLEQTQNRNGKGKFGDEFGGEGGSDSTKDQYPLRPYAEDCAYYMRTGDCKYGLFCRFNHPVKKRAIQGANERNRDDLMEQTSNIECKYYRTPTGCKFGEACRYRHEKEDTETPELNFLGLPIRKGEIVCHYYVRKGSCGYGATCKFHHPDPTDVVGPDLCNSTPILESMGGLNGSFVNHNGESDPSQQLRTSQLALASCPSHLMSDKTVSYLDKQLSHVSMMDSIYEEVDATYDWNRTQDAAYPEEDPWQMNSPVAPDNLVTRDVSAYNQQQIKLDEFPQRPGQPDCDYFLKTATCKYGSVCRYHHPKIQFLKFPENASSYKKCSPESFPQEKAWKINSAIGVDIFKKKTDVPEFHQPKIEVDGFPERPDEPDCGYFMKTGDCKYRSACKYHHPKDKISISPICALSDKGLPLRPDKTICWHYEQYGICKFGRSCLFDHPVNHLPSTTPIGLQSLLPSSSYHSAYEGTIIAGSGAGNEILISQSV